MVATLLFMELDLYGLTDHLIEGHIKRAFSGHYYTLSHIFFFFPSLRYFKHQGNLIGQLMILHEDRQKVLFEFVSAKWF